MSFYTMECKYLLNNLIVAAIPHTEPWGFNTALVMTICNLVAVAIGRLAIFARERTASANPASSSDPSPEKLGLLWNFSWAELFATLSFGHLIGVGFVLGLTNIGVI
jgi:photosystem I subunit X